MYHTALNTGDSLNEWPAVDTFRGVNGISFQHDLFDGIPIVMTHADVIYSDLPWRDGFSVFARKLGTNQRGRYIDLLNQLAGEVREVGLPTVLVTGKHAVRYLHPDHTSPVQLNGGDAIACLWGLQPWTKTKGSIELLVRLTVEFQMVADPCCGFGRSGRVFAQQGRRYIMSDLNARCIGYISKTEATWCEQEGGADE